MKKISFLFLLVFLLSAANAFAAKRYWVATANAKWNSTANWSATSGGSSGASVPGANDTAYFNSGGNFNDTLDINISVKRLEIASSYTAKFIQGSKVITIGTGGAVLSGGTFQGGTANITMSGSLVISGCAFTSTNKTIYIAGNFTFTSGSFAHNNGSIYFNNVTATITGSTTFYRLEFEASSSTKNYTLASGTKLTVDSALYTWGGSALYLLGGDSIKLKGDFYQNNTGVGGGTTVISFCGTSKQTIHGSALYGRGPLPEVFINKSDTLAFTNYVNCTSDWKYSAGTLAPGTSTVVFTNSSPTITGNQTFKGLAFYCTTGNMSVTIASGTTLTVNGALSCVGTGGIALNNGAIVAKGDLYLQNTSSVGGGTASITINGAGTQTIHGYTASWVNAYARTCSVIITKSSSDTLRLLDNINIGGGTFTYNSGIIDAGTSAVMFFGGKTITGSMTFHDIIFHTGAGANATFNIATGTTLTVEGTLYKAGATLNTILNGGAINAHGDILITNTSTGTGGTTVITINGTGNQQLRGITNPGKGRLPNIVINKSSGTLTLADTICVSGNWTYTAGTLNAGTSTVYFTDTKTITGTHTLNDVIFAANVSAGSTYSVASGSILTVSGTLSLIGGWGLTLGSGYIYAQGDISVTNTIAGGGGSAIIVINGTGDQYFRGNSSGTGYLSGIQINKPSGTLYLVNKITVWIYWSYVAGTVVPGTSTIVFFGGTSIGGNISLYNVTFSTGAGNSTFTFSSSSSITVNGTLSIIGGTGGVTLNNENIYAKGNITINNPGTVGGGSTTITINGSGTQTLSSSSLSGQGRLPRIIIDKSSDTLKLSGIISSANSWAYTQGIVNPGTSTVVFYGTLNVDGQAYGSTSTMPFYNVTIGSGTTTLAGNLNVDHNLTINSGTTLSAGSNSIFVGGDWNSQGTWTYATSTVAFDGSGYQHITAASAPVNFYNFTSNKSSKSLSLLKAVKVNNAMTLTEGHIVTTSTNYLELIDNATLTGGNDSGYVDGPMRKTGNDAFTFPLGDTTLNDTAYHPLAMTAPSGTTDQFEAEYYAVNQTYGSTLVDTLERISSDEYWRLQKNAGSSNVTATISWNRNSSIVNDYDDLRVAAWNGSKWIDRGQGAMVIHSRSGTIAATLSLNFSSQSSWGITLAREQNTQPYAILQRKLDAGYYQVSNGKLMFRFDEEYNDPDAKLSFNIYTDSYTLLTSSSIAATAQPVYYGDNRYLLNILSCDIAPNGVLTSGYFILEIINDKNEHWYLRFKHTTTLTTDCSGGGSGE